MFEFDVSGFGEPGRPFLKWFPFRPSACSRKEPSSEHAKCTCCCRLVLYVLLHCIAALCD